MIITRNSRFKSGLSRATRLVEASDYLSLPDITKKLKRALLEHPEGVAVASNQVFKNGRGQALKCFYYLNRLFVNPSYEPTENSKTIIHKESCLSDPGKVHAVYRHTEVMFHFGNSQTLRLNGWDALVVQHETDHLNGISIFDNK